MEAAHEGKGPNTMNITVTLYLYIFAFALKLTGFFIITGVTVLQSDQSIS